MFYSISIFVLFLIAGIDADCPDGSIQSSDGKLCYKAIQPTVSYGDANKVCRLIYGGLPAVQNAYDNAFINGIAIETNQSFTWLPYYYFNGAYLGPDGKPPTFTNWAPGEPTLGEGFAAALHSSDGKWRTFCTRYSDDNYKARDPYHFESSSFNQLRTPTTVFSSINQLGFSFTSDEEAVFVTDFAMSTNNNDNWQTHHDGQDDTIIGLYRADIYSQWYYTDTTPYQGFPWVAPPFGHLGLLWNADNHKSAWISRLRRLFQHWE
ncbi:unnamed protein product [Caenorhabditis auriculariae]|uniref:C-type lectin domain-containing protein n=1 Tax=Caenorhabditis auriculariae TaxID=2777116 RepID=A0A8S1HVK9_9PELO|nr:unnamed protein product [Caenorhabditis auriculariae]